MPCTVGRLRDAGDHRDEDDEGGGRPGESEQGAEEAGAQRTAACSPSRRVRAAGASSASAPLTARCAQVNGRPPLCHVILNVIVAFFFPIVSHFLARPDDHISLSFIGTIGAQLISYILGWLGSYNNLDSSLITSLGGLIYFVLVVYVILVCLLTEKKNPYQPRCGQKPPCSR